MVSDNFLSVLLSMNRLVQEIDMLKLYNISMATLNQVTNHLGKITNIKKVKDWKINMDISTLVETDED